MVVDWILGEDLSECRPGPRAGFSHLPANTSTTSRLDKEAAAVHRKNAREIRKSAPNRRSFNDTVCFGEKMASGGWNFHHEISTDDILVSILYSKTIHIETTHIETRKQHG